MTESKMSKKSSHHHAQQDQQADAGSWDTNAFDEKVKTSKDGKWKGKEAKKATRVQDISMSLASGHEPTEQPKNESWPFENSPCRMFGGKNTKGGSSDEIVNKELFKTEFGGEIKKESKTDSEESEEDNEEENESDVTDSSDDDDVDDDDGHSFGEESEELSIDAEIFDEKVQPATEEGFPPKQSNPKSERTSRRGPKCSRSMYSRSGSSQSLESTGNLSQESRSSSTRPARRSLRRSDSDRKLTKNPSKDLLGGSCHPNIETKNSRRSAKKSSSSLSAATHHGGDQPKRPRHVNRAKSSDGLEKMRVSRRGDGLSKSTHGEARSSKKSSSSSDRKTKTDRRGGLTRAMSTKNVKPPEQYSSRSNSKEGDLRRERTVAPVVTPQEQPSKKSSRPGLERKSSQRSMRSIRSKSDKSSSRSKTLSQSRRGDESESDVSEPEGKRLTSKSTRHSSSSGSIAEEPRRDLLVLLREQKTVQPTDLMDKENRRLLHFLAYEHKMGISLKELRRSVSADT